MQHTSQAHQPATLQPAAQRDAKPGCGSLSAQLAHSPRQAAQRRQLQDLRTGPVQRAEGLEEEDEAGAAQLRADPAQRQDNRTGMPDGLKASIESLSAMDMSDVRVHRNSSQPAQLNALAYAQGNDIHLGPGQEQHLPHEAWHVVQQRQGRVQATMQMAGVGVNDDEGLEREADVMGGRAVQMRTEGGKRQDLIPNPNLRYVVLQPKLMWTDATLENHKSNIGGSFETYRNILDALRRYHAFWKPEEDDEADVMIPRLQLILQHCQLQLDQYPAENRNTAVRELMAATNHEIGLYHNAATFSKENMWQEFYDTEDALTAVIKPWNHWPITGIINEVKLIWERVENKVESVKERPGKMTAAERLAYARAKSSLLTRVGLIRDFIPVLDKSRSNLALADEKLQEADQLLQKIDKLLIYHNTGGLIRTSILNEQNNAQQARATIDNTRQNIVASRTNYDQRATLDVNYVAGQELTQRDHEVTLQPGVNPSIQTIRQTLQPHTADAGFQEALLYGNLNLTSAAVNSGFWRSLTPLQKTRLNQKLDGFAPTVWGTAGYPSTRDKENSYTGGNILIPTLSGNFPLAVSGEIVHDWIFDRYRHGHSARRMKKLVDLALAEKPYVVSGFPCDAQRNHGNPETFTWKNLQLNVVVADGRTLVTYYDTY